MTRHLRIAIALFIVAAPSLAEAAVAAHVKRPHSSAAAGHQRPGRWKSVTAAAPAQAGMVVALDPETGQWGPPSPLQLSLLTRQEEQAVSRSFDGLIQVRHPDGSVSVDLQGRFQEFAVVRAGPDGKPVLRCLDDPRAIRRALADPRPVLPALEER